MYPELFRVGHLTVSTYGVLVAFAALVAGWVAARGFREHRLEANAAWGLMGYALVGGFVGARLYYVALQGDQSMLFSRGGFVWYGGLIGGSIAVVLAAWRKRLPLGRTADALAPALALGQAIGHVGCFFSGDSYGVPSDVPWAVAFPRGAPSSTAGNLRTVFGVDVPSDIADAAVLSVHPTMLYSAAALLGLFVLLWMLRKRNPPGLLFGLYLVLSGTERFLVEFLRAKDDRLLWGFTTAQAAAAAAVIGGAALLAILRVRTRRVGRRALTAAWTDDRT